jgi:glutathione S-transferase
MSLHAARLLRRALETTARADSGPSDGGAEPAIPQRHRRDQDPRAFAFVSPAAFAASVP